MAIDAKYLKASNGTGSAVLAHVTVARIAGATTLKVDNLDKWPPFFIATYGLLASNGYITEASKREFRGRISGTDIIIESFEPGFTDNGNTTQHVVIIKQTTGWADGVADTVVQQNQNISDFISSNGDYRTLAVTPSVVALGQRQYQLTYAGVDYTDRLQKKTRLRGTRGTAAPNQSTLLNGTNQYWSIANPTKFTFTNTFTYLTWVKPMSTYPAGAAALISRDSASSTGSGWEIDITSTGQISVFWRNGSGNGSYSTYDCVPLNRGFWLAVSVTASTGTVNVWIDGMPKYTQGSFTGTTIVQPTGGNLYLGQRSGITSGFFSGALAQSAVFSVALTQAQVMAYQNQGIVGTETNLISAWSLSGATGMNDLNTTTPNNLVANGGTNTTNADAPFGVQGNSNFSTTLEHGIIARVTKPGADTIVIVTSPEGGAFPTTGTVTTAYSVNAVPFGFPSERRRWQFFTVQNTVWQPSTNAVMQTTNILVDLPIGEWSLRAKWTYDAEIPSGGSISEHLMGLGTNSGATNAFSSQVLEGSCFTLYDSSNVSSHRLMQAITIPPIDVSITTLTRYYVLCTKNAGINIMFRNMVAPGIFVADNTLL